ncbi:uncharacterized protein FIBRA_09004 [Fibroporia radiculosa]|uniref:non-specific serine/threonine protein kinase n=1 Tax=Fibroporia radiculosa TaxID=599839 RepID=J4H5G8_9APHY|nr:uncharacterized protein FIBRA_09004 [Fibroporia radiculosa]CCM06714.1 predicted protein [Fibroporia radiculosa]
MEMIRESAASEEGRKVLDEHLLTVICHGDVQVKGGMRDHTREVMTNGKDISLDSGEFPLRTPSDNRTREGTAGTGRSKRRGGTHSGRGKKHSSGAKYRSSRSNTAPKGDAGHHYGDEPPPQDKHHRYYQYHPKAHYRIVFEEVCDVLHQETSLIPIFSYLSQTALVLQFLHEAGWVHRDLSTGNILIFNGKVKLADFEYAKRLDEQADAHEIRTGTADFISVEVDRQQYFFTPRGISWVEFAARMQAENGNLQSLCQESLKPKVVFRYNPMHDFESLWWISVYVLFNKQVVMVNEKSPPSHDYRRQRTWAAGVFYGLNARQSALSAGNTDFQYAIETLCPDLRSFGVVVDLLRDDLLKRYINIEADLSHLPSRAAAGEIPQHFFAGFGALGNSIINGERQEILIGPFPRQDLAVSAKAAASSVGPEGQPETKSGPAAAPAQPPKPLVSYPLGQDYLEQLPTESRFKIQTRSMTAKARAQAQESVPKTR